MEDAVEQLDKLARNVGECTRCEELVACRLRAVPGGGHPHCAVMVVSLSPDPADEKAGLRSGSTLVERLARFLPLIDFFIVKSSWCSGRPASKVASSGSRRASSFSNSSRLGRGFRV